LYQNLKRRDKGPDHIQNIRPVVVIVNQNVTGDKDDMSEDKKKPYVDKALANVIDHIRKSGGRTANDIPKATPQPKRKPEKDTRSSAQREVDAQYGRTPWNKKGSLGT